MNIYMRMYMIIDALTHLQQLLLFSMKYKNKYKIVVLTKKAARLDKNWSDVCETIYRSLDKS